MAGAAEGKRKASLIDLTDDLSDVDDGAGTSGLGKGMYDEKASDDNDSIVDLTAESKARKLPRKQFEVIAISDDEAEWGEDGGGKMGNGEIEEVHRARRSTNGSSSRKRRSGAAPSRKRQRASSSKQGGPSSGATAEDDWDDVEVVVEPVVVPSDELKGLNCSICFDAMDDGNERVLRLSCPHLFHESCMHGWIMSAIADNKIPLPCPLCTAAGVGLTDRDVEQHLTTKADKNKYRKAVLDKMVATVDGMRYCQTPDCTYAIILSQEELEAAHRRGGKVPGKCPKCKQQLRIQVEEEEEDFTRFANRQGFRKCKQCGRRIEKAGGCDKVRCVCGYRFCWKCGSPNAKCDCTPANHGFLDASQLLQPAAPSMDEILRLIRESGARQAHGRGRGRGQGRGGAGRGGRAAGQASSGAARGGGRMSTRSGGRGTANSRASGLSEACRQS